MVLTLKYCYIQDFLRIQRFPSNPWPEKLLRRFLIPASIDGAPRPPNLLPTLGWDRHREGSGIIIVKEIHWIPPDVLRLLRDGKTSASLAKGVLMVYGIVTRFLGLLEGLFVMGISAALSKIRIAAEEMNVFFGSRCSIYNWN